VSKVGEFSTRFILKKKWVTPQLFGIYDIGNSLSDCSQSMKKICVVEVFHANILKPSLLLRTKTVKQFTEPDTNSQMAHPPETCLK